MTTKDLQRQWPSFDPLPWHHGEMLSEDSLSSQGFEHVGFTNGSRLRLCIAFGSLVCILI